MPRTFLVIIFSVFFSNLLAQDNVLRRKISIEVRQTRLDETLIRISEAADFTFSYNANILSEDSIVSLQVVNSTVESILKGLLPENIIVTNTGQHLVLFRKSGDITKTDKKARYTIRGYVVNAISGEKIPDAMVYEVNGLLSAISDASGYYSISVPGMYEHMGLAFSKRWHSDTLIIVEPEDMHLDVYLYPRQKTQQLVTPEAAGIDTTTKLEAFPIVQKLVPRDMVTRSENTGVVVRRTAQISFVPVAGTNLRMGGLVENRISVNILAGYAYGVSGFEFGGLINIDRSYMKGFQVAGLGNMVGGKVKGFQFAGLYNHNGGSMSGIQLAGVHNLVVDTLRGVQFSGISNVLKGGMKGWQLAGINNLTTRNVDGIQFAGISNIAKGDVRLMQFAGIVNKGRNVKGLQFGGLVNIASQDVRGLQIAGLVNTGRNVNAVQFAGLANIARDTVKGLQISGLFNFAKHTKSSQFALINYADTASGVPIGLISIVKKGYVKLELSANETIYGNFAVKTGVRRFYNIFTAGVGSRNGDIVWSYGYGVGTEKSLSGKTIFHFDYTANWVSEGHEHSSELSLLNRLSFNFGWPLGRKVSLSIGPSINVWLSEWIDPNTGEHLTRLAPYTLFESTVSTTLIQVWVGGKFSFKFL